MHGFEYTNFCVSDTDQQKDSKNLVMLRHPAAQRLDGRAEVSNITSSLQVHVGRKKASTAFEAIPPALKDYKPELPDACQG